MGHVVSKDGITVDPGKIRAIIEWGSPKNVDEIVEILNNMTHIHRDYPDYTLISKTCIIHNLLYVDHQFIEAETFRGAHRSINHTYQHSIFSGKVSR